ncbi:centrosomal protein of 72 kDa [Heptranchias perlo]|uniref:centrosomal protein of 72 kDa n=1 Tax=Heptranchias perlo TaxID=212740 RepID=UPI003559A603
MALMVTEDWIRRRVALEAERLADVRSLFLPGSYEEKITHLGTSLKNFTRLKSLDLSRNSLVSLEGIQHLIHLEKLNLYYNNIANLKEIFLLRNLGGLKELDLRLNPVSKNESDYRLFVVHMLPNLRRLDDRPIRDSERKAALMHFSTDQAYEFHDYSTQEVENERPRHLRAAFVSSLTKKCSALDEDDEAVLNLIAKCGWDLSEPSGITGSAKSAPEAELHNLQGIREIDDAAGSQETVVRNTSQSTRSLPVNIPKVIVNSQKKTSVEFQAGTEDHPTLPNASSSRSRTIACGADITARGIRVTFADEKTREFAEVDTNLKFQDEAEAYHRITSRPHFTPHPGTSHNPPAPAHQLPRSTVSCTFASPLSAHEVNGENPKAGDQPARQAHCHPTAAPQLQGEHPTGAPTAPASRHDQMEDPHVRRQSAPQRSGSHDRRSNGTSSRACETVHPTSSEVLSTEYTAIDASFFNPTFMDSFLDLVDRYWNGFKSLHCNDIFLNQARKMICDIQQEVALENQEIMKHQEGLNHLKAKNDSLEACLCQQQQQYTEELQRMSVQLTEAERDVEMLKDHLGQTVDEKNHLQNLLIKLEQKAHNTSNSTNQQVEELQSHNQQLRCEIDNLKHQVQCYNKIQELTDKLQESHRALVCTNEHLLRELNETRARHKAEVDQLHWSYIQLKKTMEQPTRTTTMTTSGCISSSREIKSHIEIEDQRR